MEALKEETLQALGEVSPEVLRALAGVPVEVLLALREASADALSGQRPRVSAELAKQPSGSSPFTGSGGDELTLALEQVDTALKETDADVVMCFGKYRDPKNPENCHGWWNGWIDSGGGGVSGLLAMPDYEVAEVFSVLGSPVRLAILRSLLADPKSAAELVADRRLGTTGQAYHHLQELIRTGFVEARHGRYHFNGARMRAYFTALAVAADFVPKSSADSGK